MPITSKTFSIGITLASLLGASAVLAQSASIEALAKRFKPGQYEYTVEADLANMPGMPKGFKIPAMTYSHCVTAKDIEEGKQFSQGNQQGDMKCQFSNVKINGNSGSYTQQCTSPDGTVRADVQFMLNGDTSVFQMLNEVRSKDAPPMKTKANMTMRYKGGC